MLSTAAVAVPPPPPAPADAAFYDAFFTALPRQFPASDISALEALVAADLQVYNEGKLLHSSAGSWIVWLQGMSGYDRSNVSLRTDREEFFFQPENRIMVREAWWPQSRVSAGMPEFPDRLVSYQFAGRKLVRVDYGPRLRRIPSKLGKSNG